jgi:hypothetical protein
VFSSNLNNKGPDNAEKEGIRIASLGSHEGKKFDLLVNCYTGNYEAPSEFYQYNNVFGYFGYIIVGMNTQMDLRFRIVESGTNTSLVLPKWYMTFFDLDKSVDTDDPSAASGTEKMAVKGFSKYLTGDTSNKSQLIITKDDPPGFTSFQATTWGNTDDNPSNPMNLNDDHKQKAVTFEFKDTATFDATYTVSGCFDDSDFKNCTDAREMFFAGKSQLATDPCGMPPASSSRVVEQPHDPPRDKLKVEG